MVWFPVKPVDVQVTPASVVRKRPPDEKLSQADIRRVCGLVGEAHSLGPRKNAGKPVEELNHDAPLSVERSAPPMLSPDSLFQAATMSWSVPSSTISRSVTLSIVPAVLSKTLVQDWPASVLRQTVPSNPATPKSAPPSRIKLGLL